MAPFDLDLQDNGSPSRSLLPLLQKQTLPQVPIQPWCTRLEGVYNRYIGVATKSVTVLG